MTLFFHRTAGSCYVSFFKGMFGHAVNKEYLFLPKGQLDANTEYQLSAKHGRLQRNSHVASVVLRLYERRARYLTTSSPLSIMGSNASL